MSCPEIAQMYDRMTHDMTQKLNNYSISLQSRFGDPRVYAQQEEEIAKQRSRVQYNRTKKTAKLLEDAYQRQSERNRNIHHERINNRFHQKSTSLPESKKKAHVRFQTAQPERVEAQPSNQEPPSVSS